jgi:Nuclease-related domain
MSVEWLGPTPLGPSGVGGACCYRVRMSGNLVANIYIGGPIDQDSERKFLASAVQWLEEQQIPFVVLANLHIGGRQIDCIVATAHGVSVVEVKSSYLPVRGDINGIWARLHASGEWRPYTNAYQQALTAKNALRDAMMAAKPVSIPMAPSSPSASLRRFSMSAGRHPMTNVVRKLT